MSNHSDEEDQGDQETPDNLVISYLALRKAIGVIGIALPIVLAIGKILVESPGIQSSISHYYYSEMRNVFVGSLAAMGIFLLSYRGYDRRDDLAGDLACLSAIGVALLPVAPVLNPTATEILVGRLHLLCASVLFLTFAYFSLVLFRKGKAVPTPRKILRNRVYSYCGYLILGCLLAIGIVMMQSPESPVNRLNPVFWLESIAIWAFGWAWYTKGEGILPDKTT